MNVTKVTSCRSCPFYTVEGMEHMMMCDHPYWKGKEPYAGAIITHNNRDGIPDKCPLRRGAHVETIKVMLKGLR